jgi:uncharacterized membrane protein YedE/YeeE
VTDAAPAATTGGEVGTIRRSARRAPAKKKANQIPIGLALLAVIVVAAVLLGAGSATLGFFWVTGIIFGFILQKTRFCFTASMRDPYLTGGTSLTKAVLAALAITTVGFAAIKYGAFARGLPIPGQSFVVPVSFATVFGGFTFGVGMVIAGGCASGTLMRVGEGFWMQTLSLFFFVVGSLWGAHDFGWWKLNFIARARSVFLPDVFGWAGAVALQLAIIACLWIAADKWAKHKNAAQH